ncbi:hypothetical protein AJ79_02559 [Helicocarpus griseus UAMH5409]|uniref:Uncharacterized protein n=1 Tax=Helicocarpus griseus UAMH5409 TaxID=1447875 RepID=A0A2B7XTU9_9EURO|nr:hypothetical protein AJ79_02559 [Helicocarpus griseus UAMH5409]
MTRDFGDATKPAYNPVDKDRRDSPFVLEGLASTYTEAVMNDCFKQTLFKQLPPELQLAVSRFIGPCWYLIVLGETHHLIEQMQKNHSIQRTQLTPSQNIYLTRTIYQGESYTSEINATPLELHGQGSLEQESITLTAVITKVVMSTDHVGIRRIQLLGKDSQPSPDDSPWYEIIQSPGIHSGFRVIHSFPAKQCVGSDNSRTLLLGRMPTELQPDFKFTPLVGEGDGILSGLIHNGLDPNSQFISELGVTCNPHRGTGITRCPQPSFAPYDQPPVLPFRTSRVTTTWYITKAPLGRLSGVQICQDQELPHRPCLGLLLYYEDGSVEAVGQIRWDRTISSKVHVPICLRNKEFERRNYISEVREFGRLASNAEDDGWQEVPEKGTIVWWLSHIGDRVTIYSD